MRNYLVLLIAKYCRLLKAVNRLKCGKKVKGSIMGTAEDILNTILAAMAPEDRSFKAAMEVLEDGEALAALGLGDADQDAIERAHAKAKSFHPTCACCN